MGATALWTCHHRNLAATLLLKCAEESISIRKHDNKRLRRELRGLLSYVLVPWTNGCGDFINNRANYDCLDDSGAAQLRAPHLVLQQLVNHRRTNFSDEYGAPSFSNDASESACMWPKSANTATGKKKRLCAKCVHALWHWWRNDIRDRTKNQRIHIPIQFIKCTRCPRMSWNVSEEYSSKWNTFVFICLSMSNVYFFVIRMLHTFFTVKAWWHHMYVYLQ